MKRLLLVGGGHAHIEVLRSLAAAPAAGVETVLVTPSPRLPYTGMVPGYIAGHYTLAQCTIDLERLAARAGARLHLARAALVSPREREVACADGSAAAYDILSLDVGSQPLLGEARGAERHAIPMRPLEDAIAAWDRVHARALAGGLDSITVVGGGAGGIEVAAAMKHRLRATVAAPVHVRLISEAAGSGIGAGAARRLRQRLRRLGVDSHVGSRVAEVGAGYLRLASGLEFATDAVFWATGPAAPGWLRDSGLATDPHGFMLTNDRLQSVWYADVFGAGDCATIEGRALPKAGVFAVRAAPVLAHNLRAALAGEPLLAHRTRARFLALVSTGERHAVGMWGPLSWQGRWAWRWKDRIDRRFVARYR